jgi:hypothetical protein
LRARNFSATRLPTSAGELPAGHLRKYDDWPSAQVGVVKTAAITSSPVQRSRSLFINSVSLPPYRSLIDCLKRKAEELAYHKLPGFEKRFKFESV